MTKVDLFLNDPELFETLNATGIFNEPEVIESIKLTKVEDDK